jgi:hypothetical protein
MPTNIEKIVDGFPHLTIVSITGVPSYETITSLNLQLNANASSVQSNLGDGLLGLLYLTVTPVEYNTMSNVAFDPPDNSGPVPPMADNATGAQITASIHKHNTRMKFFKEYLATDKALKHQSLRAVNSMHVPAHTPTLHHRICKSHNSGNARPSLL